jgi:hypothetical protein
MKHFLSWNFYVWACTYFFLFHYELHSHKMLYNKWCSLYYGVHYVKRNNWKINELKNERCFSYVFFILVNLFFDHLIKFCASRHYYIGQVIWHQPIYTCTNMFLNDKHIHLSKGMKNTWTLTTYIFVKLFKQDEIKDEIIK